MKIIIATLGTRGDVQPFVALGKGLIAAGHQVVLATCEHFEPFIRAHGLEYGYVNNELIEFLHSEDGKIAMENSANLRETIATAIRLGPKLGAMVRRQMDDMWAACEQHAPDLVIYHPKVAGAADFAEKLGVPCILAFYLPMFAPTSEFPVARFPEWPLGGWYNRFTYRLVRGAFWLVSGRVKRWRTQHGLAARSPALKLQLPDGRPIPVLQAYSPQVIARPSDWPDWAQATGFWFLDEQQDWTPPKELVDFLNDGPPPVYFGFGSIFGRSPQRVAELILQAVQQTGVRAILLRGWGGLEPPARALGDNVLFIDSAPHDWLFTRMRAVVHHGGCGTTAAVLRAGKPQIICPFFGDQPFWGNVVAKLGVGPPPIAQRRLTVERLSTALQQVMDNPTMHAKAAELGESIRQEHGVAEAVAFVNQWYDKLR